MSFVLSNHFFTKNVMTGRTLPYTYIFQSFQLTPTQNTNSLLKRSPQYNTNNMTMNPLLDVNATTMTLAAMCQQEEQGYKTYPYLHQIQPSHIVVGPAHLVTTTEEATTAAAKTAVFVADMECRSNMVAWCYQVVDFCKFHRETVAISLNMLDRFLACSDSSCPLAVLAKQDVKVYQLACMTTLYTAVKIHEPQAMDPKIVSALSQGTYSPAQIEDMERNILMALTWRVNPPTAMAFIRQFLDLILPASLQNGHDSHQQRQRDAIYDLAKLQTELEVSEYRFLGIRASVIAYCALLNALESVGMDTKTLAYTRVVLSHAIGLQQQDDDTTIQVQDWLYEAVLANQSDAAEEVSTVSDSDASSSSNKAIQQTSSILTSPRSTAQCTL
jgi:Cyclin, N-terminal domain/Cyclin, C-terminal domain